MHLLVVVAALGAVQGLLLLVLIGVRFRSRANFPLALLLFVFPLRLGTIPAWTPEGLLAAPWLLPVAGAAPLLFGPLVWWYVRELIREDLAPPPYLALHAAPWMIETIVLSALIVSLDATGYRALVADLFAQPAPWWMPARHAIKAVLSTAYAVVAIKIAFGSESRAAHVTATRRLWARLVVALPLVCLASFLLIAVQPTAPAMTPDGANARFYAPAVAMMLTTYAFSLMVLIAPGVLILGGKKPRNEPPAGIEESEIASIVDRFRAQLQSDVYRDTELTITRLAKKIGVHPYRLSLVINHVYGKNFSQLIHDHRLEYFLERTRAGDLEKYTILRLAFEAGFPSKSTFHRVFRERFGASPGEYLRDEKRSATGVGS
ncbi:MAG: AraC family transcriptional regulator [Spirochaetaceae bacterium]|nr:MAG: AraC family transcriptional regulator [Spirochaetaceae bacterium]